MSEDFKVNKPTESVAVASSFITLIVFCASAAAQTADAPRAQPLELRTFDFPAMVNCTAGHARRCDGEARVTLETGFQVCRASIIGHRNTRWRETRATFAGYPIEVNPNDQGPAKRFRGVRLVHTAWGEGNYPIYLNIGVRITALPLSASSDDRFGAGCQLVRENESLFSGNRARQIPRTY